MGLPTTDLRRRDFGKTVIVGVAVAAAAPMAARAAGGDPNENVMFTASDPGHWAGKEGAHVPVVTVADGALTVKTPHPMSEAHFIVSHSVVLADGRYLGRQVFTYKDQPISTYTLPPGYKGKVTVTSTCNLHDFWLTTITV
jgi:superoxide reductase